MNGYTRRGYWPTPEGGGFYSPYMKHPHYAGGMRQILNQLMAMKQMRQAEEQQVYERGITERRMGLSEEELRLREKEMGLRYAPEEAKPTALQEKIQALLDAGYPEAEARRLAVLGRPPVGRAAPTMADIQKEYRGRITDINERYEGAEMRANTAFSNTLTGIISDWQFQEFVKPEERQRIISEARQRHQTNIDAIRTARDREISLLQDEYTMLPQFKGKKKTTREELEPTGELEATVLGNTVIVGGKSYALNADGTVTIEGVQYKIK